MVLPLAQGPVVTFDTIQPIGGAELHKPGTDAVIITWGTMVPETKIETSSRV